MLLSGDIRRIPPSFSSDSSRLYVAASGARDSVLVQVATRTSKIVSIEASVDVKGITPYRNGLAVSSSSGITLGEKSVTNMTGSQLTAGLGGLVFKSKACAHVIRNFEVVDLPLELHHILVANGDFAIGSSWSDFQVWCDEWETPIDFTHNRRITALAAGPGVLAVGDVQGIITTWHVLKKSLPKKRPKQDLFSAKNHWHANQVNALAFLGNSVVSGGEEGVLRLWHLEGQTIQNVPRLGAGILHIVVSLDERWIAATLEDNSLVLLDSGDLLVKRAITALEPSVGPCLPLATNALCFGLHGKLAFVDRPFEAKTVPLWKRNYVAQHGTPWKLVCMAFSSDERTLVTCESMKMDNLYRQVMKWWILDNTGYTIDSVVYDAHAGRVTSVMAHPTRDLFFSVCSLGVIKTWEFLEVDGRNAWIPSAEGIWHNKEITAADISADGSLLCLAYTRHVLLWEPMSHRYVHSWRHGESGLRDIRFYHPWGEDLMVCTLFANQLKIWNVLDGGALLQTLSIKASFMSISPSRRKLALCGGDTMKVYRLDKKLVVEKEISCVGVRAALWASDDKLALVAGAGVEITSLDDAKLSYETYEDEIVEKAVATAEAQPYTNNLLQVVRGVQHCDMLEKLVVPKSSPTHLLPPCKLLLQRYLAAFARKDVHPVQKEPAPPVAADLDAILDVDDIDELGPIVDEAFVAAIVAK